ncbi:hypothetical protein [Methyloglobulus sp.]|uniref:hypothetical protein n=1 Tax=Methyloglobulus sp. TaxID=2518622 RepID=UPI0032B85CA9
METNLTQPLSQDDQTRLWLRAWHQLHAMRDNSITAHDIDEAIKTLPVRLAKEKLADWLHRAEYYMVADFIRHAASSGSERYPLPEHPLETDDFRLTIAKKNEGLEITIQALAGAIDEFADCLFEIVDGTGENQKSLAEFMLDEKGYARICLPDNDENRRALLRPQLWRKNQIME